MKAHAATAARPSPLALPLEGSPAEEAALRGGLHLKEQTAERRRELGQFFTPVPVARFMARLARPGRRQASADSWRTSRPQKQQRGGVIPAQCSRPSILGRSSIGMLRHARMPKPTSQQVAASSIHSR